MWDVHVHVLHGGRHKQKSGGANTEYIQVVPCI